MFTKKNKLSNTELIYDYRDSLSERDLLILELKEAKLAMDAAYSTMQNVTEPELIDSAIYEFNSTQMKYRFLHRKYSEIK